MNATMVTRYARSKELLEAELGEDLVGLDVDSGHCFGFNSVAADIWRLLAQPQEFEALRQALIGQYDVDAGQCETELRACLSTLESRGLVRTIQEAR
jgi:hypothetical protein